jgi:hypothetical protein
MDTTRLKITFCVVDEWSLIYITPIELAATERKEIKDSLAPELRIWLVSKQLTSSNHQPGSRMAASQWKNNIWRDGRALPSLYQPYRGFRERCKENRCLLAYGVGGLVGFRKD